MNKLEKFFNTLHGNNPRLLKKYTTDELVAQVKEYTDFTPYLCKNIYKLLISQNLDDRINGAEILKSIMFQFKLTTNFIVEYKDSKDEYLSSTGEAFCGETLSIQEQKKLLKKMAELEHVENNIVSEIDFKGDTKLEIKKQKIKDRPIENVVDFFENLSNNLLNYEWNKRHGAFLAYCAIFETDTTGTIEIKVDTSLFTKIYEILKSDKFNDFIDDQTSAPVRDSAAKLLANIYPRMPTNNIIAELFKFLDDCDWQVQYSGLLAIKYLKEFVKDKILLCTKLENLLCAEDEDVKYLAADLLIYFYEFCNKQSVIEKCIKEIENDKDISISKVSIIQLLSLGNHKFKDNSCLYNYFTSPIPDIRKSILKMAEELKDDSVNFLIGELILIEEKDEIRDLAISVLKKKDLLEDDFVKHFSLLCSGSIYKPYVESDFVCYDDLFFTSSGIKTLGPDKILNNRIDLLNLLNEKGNLEELSFDEYFSTGFLVKRIYNLHKQLKKQTGSTNFVKEDDCEIIKRKKLCNDIDSIYAKYGDLRMAPLKELKSKILNPEKQSIHSMGQSVFIDYLRYVALLNFPNLSEEIILVFKYETSKKFVYCISNLIISFYNKNQIDISDFIVNCFQNLITNTNDKNFLVFFEIFGLRFLETNFFMQLENDKQKIKFFEKTISFYKSSFCKLENLYQEAIKIKSCKILIGFMQDIKYLEDFVGRMLSSFNLELFNLVLENINYSYYPLFIKPLLNLMSSATHQALASKCFSYIIPRLHFKGITEISDFYKNKISKELENLECLLDSSKIPEYTFKCPINVELRKYQLEGVKWLNFLHSFNLNGILADDMGLGKTVQVLSFLCSEMYKTDKKVLVVCPSSLTGHWKSEIQKFFPFFEAVCYKKNIIHTGDFLIVSYDTYRNDYLFFNDKLWFYVIFDEGHILRNSNTISYQRVSNLKCQNRLILTGTPIHNSVEDLVNLFNLIMPNYLGNIKNIPMMTSKMSDAEIEDIHDRLNFLNKKVLPFILRRLKVDVLTDLPPKIIQDLIIEMDIVQRDIYKSIADNDSTLSHLSYKSIDNKTNGLNRTRDLLKICSHISYQNNTLQNNTQVKSCKMKALEEIIQLCGGDNIKNKILVFFQYKSTIDLVIQDFNKKFNLKYVRLDGTVPSSKRSKIALDFNTGNIPIMFLTTHVGGLGLNLTGADTVIFYEHDWNPFNDLQAMDRAHRLGQRRTVNVYRFIVKDTIEEDVMNLQNFKMFIASSIVSQQNTEVVSMDTKDLLERFV